jgi:hypothetical protein
MDIENRKKSITDAHLGSLKKVNKKSIHLTYISSCKSLGYQYFIPPSRLDLAIAMGVQKSLERSGSPKSVLDLIKDLVEGWEHLDIAQKCKVPDLRMLPVVYRKLMNIPEEKEEDVEYGDPE